MPKDYSRSLRIADQIQRELADLIRNDLNDPRIGMITLTGVEVSQDYAHAKVFTRRCVAKATISSPAKDWKTHLDFYATI